MGKGCARSVNGRNRGHLPAQAGYRFGEFSTGIVQSEPFPGRIGGKAVNRFSNSHKDVIKTR